jgi:hypothetical protein
LVSTFQRYAVDLAAFTPPDADTIYKPRERSTVQLLFPALLQHQVGLPVEVDRLAALGEVDHRLTHLAPVLHVLTIQVMPSSFQELRDVLTRVRGDFIANVVKEGPTCRPRSSRSARNRR